MLPTLPGCYIYRDKEGSVLYVGKAVNLRSRVRSYFRNSTKHGPRIERLVYKIADIEWIVVESELEALVLECNLIKQHRPPFNVRMRDDKSYPYIAVTNEPFPRVLFTRNPRKGSGKVYGPYTSAFAVRDTLDILHKNFPLIPCGKSWSGKAEQRPCLYFHLKQCLAPCAGMAARSEYDKVLQQVHLFLSGKGEIMLDSMQREMDRASEALEYEQAASIRDRMNAIQRLTERQNVMSTDGVDRDVIAVVRDDRGSAIQMLYIRGGKLIGQRQYILDGSADASPGESVQEFVKQYYAQAPEVPREVLLPVEIEERHIVQQWLRTRRGAAVTMEVPAGGEKLRLVDIAASNASQALQTMRQELEQKEAWAEEAMQQLAEALSLPSLPQRIEGYDISNTQGTAPVSSMVVVENGEPAKGEYRRFKIRWHPEDPNDFAMMHETITRRLRNYLDGNEKFSKLPDLFMIDGGKGQLSAALQARDELGLSVPMIGLAKKMELIYIPIEGSSPSILPKETREYEFKGVQRQYEYEAIELPLTSPGLMMLRKLRDEAHRFALTFHRKVRTKRMTGSALEEIPGVGPRRRRMLLRTFGSIEAIRRASVDELASVPTMTKVLAQQLKDYLNDGMND